MIRTKYAAYISCLWLLFSCTAQKRLSGQYSPNDLIRDTLLKHAHIGISVYDTHADKYIYGYQDDKYFVPASNTKIITCYAALKYLGGVTKNLYGHTDTVLGKGWSWDDYKEVENPFTYQYTDTGLIWSGPADSLLKPMMYRSDNFLAEAILQMIGEQLTGQNNIALAIDSLLKTVLSDLPQTPVWVDGCGLSRYNLFSPKDMVTVLNKTRKEFGMKKVQQLFPTADSGTLKGYFLADNGNIYAKTGSLSGVAALSGYLYTRKGRLLIFSVLVNNFKGSGTAMKRKIERLVQSFIASKYPL